MVLLKAKEIGANLLGKVLFMNFILTRVRCRCSTYYHLSDVVKQISIEITLHNVNWIQRCNHIYFPNVLFYLEPRN